MGCAGSQAPPQLPGQTPPPQPQAPAANAGQNNCSCGSCKKIFAVNADGLVACPHCGVHCQVTRNHVPQPQPTGASIQMQCGGCKHIFPTAAGGGLVTCPSCKAQIQAPLPQTTSGMSLASGASAASGSSVISLQCGACKNICSAPAGQVTTCPSCKQQIAPPGVVAPAPAPAPMAQLSVACGGCTKILQVQPSQEGKLQFKCPHCQAQNEIQVDNKAGGSTELKVELPSWWIEKPRWGENSLSGVSNDVQEAIQRLINDTWKPITTRDRGFAEVKKLTVTNVLHNANPKLWQNYVNAREKIKVNMMINGIHEEIKTATSVVLDDINKYSGMAEPLLGKLDKSVNECLVFHGTKPSACENICKSDFMVSMAGSNAGALYGPGVYFGENSSKSDEYAADESTGIYKNLYAMLLCRVTCGRMLVTEEEKPDKDKLVSKCKSEYHSVLGDRAKAKGTYRELIVYNNDMAYPEYVIIYRRET